MFGKVLMISLAALVVWGVVVRASNGAGPERVYVVQPHDTLWTIAAKTHGGDPRAVIWRIQKANHLAGATIVPGQRLHIPG